MLLSSGVSLGPIKVVTLTSIHYNYTLGSLQLGFDKISLHSTPCIDLDYYRMPHMFSDLYCSALVVHFQDRAPYHEATNLASYLQNMYLFVRLSACPLSEISLSFAHAQGGSAQLCASLRPMLLHIMPAELELAHWNISPSHRYTVPDH